jgi:hypothetical protein
VNNKEIKGEKEKEILLVHLWLLKNKKLTNGPAFRSNYYTE